MQHVPGTRKLLQIPADLSKANLDKRIRHTALDVVKYLAKAPSESNQEVLTSALLTYFSYNQVRHSYSFLAKEA